MLQSLWVILHSVVRWLLGNMMNHRYELLAAKFGCITSDHVKGVCEQTDRQTEICCITIRCVKSLVGCDQSYQGQLKLIQHQVFEFRTVVSIWSVVILATEVSACHTTDHITDVSAFMTYMVIRRHQSHLPNIDYINGTTPSIIVTNSIMIKMIQQHKGGMLRVVQSDISSSHIIWYLVSL